MKHDPWSETADEGATGQRPAEELAALTAAAETLTPAEWPRTLREVSRRLASGASLEQALAALQTRLPGRLRELVTAGLRDGTLGEVLEQFAAQQRATAELRRAARAKLLHPAATLAAALWLVLLCVQLIVPGIERVLRKHEVDLPERARLPVWLSAEGEWVVWLALLLGPAAVLAVWLASRSARQGHLPRAIPGIGPLWRWIGLAEWSRLMGLLLRQKTPLPRALLLASEGLRDAEWSAVSRSLSARVGAGATFAAAVAAEPAFPPTLRNVLVEERRDPADSLLAAGDLCEARVRLRLSLWETVLPPLACLASAAAAGILVSSMYAALLAAIEIAQALS